LLSFFSQRFSNHLPSGVRAYNNGGIGACDTLFVSLITIISALPFHFEQAQHLLDYFNHSSSFDWNLLPQHFPDPLCIFFTALCNGLPWVTVLAWFSSLSAGWFTPNSFCFASAKFRTVPPQTKLQCFNLVHPDITGHLTLFLFADSIVFIVAPFTLRVQWVDTRLLVHLISRPGYDFPSRFWPDYDRMPTDDNGHHSSSFDSLKRFLLLPYL
jgi:hypothetical protein